MGNAWSHLPNAHHIDWVLESVKENPKLWDIEFQKIWGSNESFRKDYANACEIASMICVSKIFTKIPDLKITSESLGTRFLVTKVIIALFAYNDCEKIINMPYEKLKVWAELSKNPRAIILLPMVYIKEEQIKKIDLNK